MIRFTALLLAFTIAPNSVFGELDPETTKPYEVRVIVHVGPHPVFTPLFKERLMRGLQDGLQGSLGNMCRVEVLGKALLEENLNRKPNGNKNRSLSLQRSLKLLQEVTDHGLESALDSWKEVSETKTHFVTVDFAEGLYEIQARQFDGFTGLPGPVVRQARTRDHAFVLRLAGFIIEKDFGVVGTVTPTEKIDEVQVTLKAGNMGKPMTPWAKKGEVFAVSQIFRGGTRAQRLSETLVQVLENPEGGKCKGRILHRYKPALPTGPAILGYRCLKLGTTQAPLRLRLVDEKGHPRAAMHITVSADDFGANIKESRSTNADGFTQEMGPFQHVAFVSVLGEGEKLLAQLPIEILDDRPVVREINVDPKEGQRGQFEFDMKFLLKRLDESLLASTGLMEEINATKSNEEKLKKTKAGVKELVTDLAGYNEELIHLRSAAGSMNLSTIQNRYQDLVKKKDKFEKYITELAEAVAVEKDPLRTELLEMAGRARLLESEYEIDQAIELYEKMVQKAGNMRGFEAYPKLLAELKKNWEPRNEAHRQARAFIYQTWPKLETAAQIKPQLEPAFKALRTCKEVGDRKTPWKLLKANTAHATNLTRRLEKIRSSTNAEELAEGKVIIELQEGLEKLHNEALQFVQENGGK